MIPQSLKIGDFKGSGNAVNHIGSVLDYIIEVKINETYFSAARHKPLDYTSYEWSDINLNGVYLGPIVNGGTDMASEKINDSKRSNSTTPLEIKIDADSSTLVNIPILKMVELTSEELKTSTNP